MAETSPIEYYKLHKDKYSVFDSKHVPIKGSKMLYNKIQGKSENTTKAWLDYDMFMTWELVAKADAERTQYLDSSLQ